MVKKNTKYIMNSFFNNFFFVQMKKVINCFLFGKVKKSIFMFIKIYYINVILLIDLLCMYILFCKRAGDFVEMKFE